MIARRKTRQIRVGGVRVGAGAPISIQSMIKVETSNIKAAVSEIKKLEFSGCEIVRAAVKTIKDARALKDIKKKTKIPLVADIHFDYRLALESIKNRADKIRLNPGNIRNHSEIAQVVRAAKKAGIPIRIGANSGSFPGDLVKGVQGYIKIFEELDFRDIILSLKASDVVTTIEAYRRIAKTSDYPLHLGVTAAGPIDYGIVKSSVGIGALLADGIGDTIRVSLTADPVEEVIAGKRILGSLGLRNFGRPEIISCPTCGRCQVDLISIVNKLDKTIHNTQYTIRKEPLTIAIMGCEVNGPGEAREADIGIAFGAVSGMLFKKGKIIKKVSVQNVVKELMQEIDKLG